MANLKLKGRLNLGLALICIGVFVGLLIRGRPTGTYSSQASVLVMLVIASLIFAGIGRALLRQARRLEAGDPAPRVDFSHTYRLTGALALILVFGAAARQLAIPAGFGRYGHYRIEAIGKALGVPQRHQGEKSCASCKAKDHEKNYALHAKGMHKPVQCEVCHGPGDRHAAANSKQFIEKKKLACLVCHQKLASRPETFPQIDVNTHFKNKGVAKDATRCWRCHNPHQPLFIDQDAASARVHHPVSHQCRDCHAHMPTNTPKPRKHPIVFDCNYCHPDKAKAVAARPHRHLGCRSCHKFSRAAKYYGYIIRFMAKNRDRRFCLMCHDRIEGRTGTKPPTIAWKTHLKEMAGSLDSSCVECHQDTIHPVKKKRSGAVSPRPAPAAPGDTPDPMKPAASGEGPRAAPMTAMAPMVTMAPTTPMAAPMGAMPARPRVRPRPMARPRPRPRRRAPRMPASHRGSASHKTCNRACHSGLLPASHRGRGGSSCRACHR